jgi:hypothetical protein
MTMPDLIPSMTDTQKINMNIITLNTRTNQQQSDIEELQKVVLLGNGEPAIRETVRNHTAILAEWKYWIKFFVGLLITQAVAVVGALVFTVIKLLPVLERLANKP